MAEREREREREKERETEEEEGREREREGEREQKALPRGVVSLSALGAGRPTTVSYTAEDIHWQPRSTSGFLIMKCSRLQSFPVQIYSRESSHCECQLLELFFKNLAPEL